MRKKRKKKKKKNLQRLGIWLFWCQRCESSLSLSLSLYKDPFFPWFSFHCELLRISIVAFSESRKVKEHSTVTNLLLKIMWINYVEMRSWLHGSAVIGIYLLFDCMNNKVLFWGSPLLSSSFDVLEVMLTIYWNWDNIDCCLGFYFTSFFIVILVIFILILCYLLL